MDKISIINETEKYVRHKLEGEGSGHDWWHIVRVKNMAGHIAESEGNVDSFFHIRGAGNGSLWSSFARNGT